MKNYKHGKVQNYEFTWSPKDKLNNDNNTKGNVNKHKSLNDKQTQMILDNVI